MLPLIFLTSVAEAAVPNDAEYFYQPYLQKMGAEAAWDITTGNQQVIVAVIDTGVDVNHPDLLPNIMSNSGEIPRDNIDNDNNGYIDDQYGWDAIEGSGSGVVAFAPDEVNKLGINHGTIVAGIIGAVGNNALGTTGVAWQVRLLPIRALTKDGDGSTKIIARAVEYALKMKADIINLSFVGEQMDSDLQSALQHAISAGVLVVVAAGNEANLNLNLNPRYPICAEISKEGPGALLGVSAVDNNLTRATFASYGDRCVQLSTFGVGLRSTRVKYVVPGSSEIYLTVGGLDGTSVASPLVAGAAALIKSVLPEAKGKKIMEILTETGLDITDQNQTLTPNALGKLLQLDKAVYEAKKFSETLKKRELLILGRTSQGKVVSYNQAGEEKKVNIAGLPQGTVYSVKSDPADGLAPMLWSFTDGRLAVSNQTGGFYSFYPYGRTGRPVQAIILKSGGNYVIATLPATFGSDDLQIWNLTGKKLGQFRVFGDKLNSGYSLAKIDWNNDGTDEILITRATRKSDIRLFDQHSHLLKKWSNPFATGLTIAALQTGEDKTIMIAESQSYRAQVAILDQATSGVAHIFGTILSRGFKTDLVLIGQSDKLFKNISKVGVYYRNVSGAGIKWYSTEGVLRGLTSLPTSLKYLGQISVGGELD